MGFSTGRQLLFSDLDLQTPNEFAVILATSLDREQPIATADRVLITTIARARNTGMRYNAESDF